MSAAVVSVELLRRTVGARRLALRDQRAHITRGHQLAEASHAAADIDVRLLELEELEALLEAAIAEHARPNPVDVSRPSVLLVGAGIRGDVTVPADLETLDTGLLSDRDLAVYTGLVRYVAERLEREAMGRLYRDYPQRVALGVGGAFGGGGLLTEDGPRPHLWAIGHPAAAAPDDDDLEEAPRD